MPGAGPVSFVPHPAACACGSCLAGPSRLHGNVDGLGGTIDGKPVWTAAEVAAHLNRSAFPDQTDEGPGWGDDGVAARPASGDPAVLSFGFHSQATMDASSYASVVGMKEYPGFQPFLADQEEAARKAVLLWNDLVAIDIVEVAADQADITFGNYGNQPGTQAYAYLPYDYAPPDTEFAGDVWINVNQGDNLELDNGFYGLHVLVHETGHALGLMHPGDYDAGDGGTITYSSDAEYYQDSRQYSVMSYFNAEFTGGGHVDWSRVHWVYGQTPLLHDILAIQSIYGADPTTRTGATVYGFNGNAGRDVFDFALNAMPVLTIYDAGGIDTLDFSGWDSPSTIDLNPGGFSSGGGSGVVPLEELQAEGKLTGYTQAQYDALRAAYHALDGMLHDNVSIAYGTIIENAIGGGGDDTITGNSVRNLLSGRDGDDAISGLGHNDVLYGGAGNDTLDGGSGFDEMFGSAGSDALRGGSNGNDRLDGGSGADSLTGGTGHDTYVVDNSGDVVVEAGQGGTDTVESSVDFRLPTHVERLILTGTGSRTGAGNSADNNVTGNAGNNTLNGGSGDDRVDGGAGNDLVYGHTGSDRLTGGAGVDGFVFNSALGATNVDRILDYWAPNDSIYIARYTFTAAGPNGTLNAAAFHAGTTAADASDRILYDQASGNIFYDSDGTGAAAPILFATVNAGVPLTAADFIIYD